MILLLERVFGLVGNSLVRCSANAQNETPDGGHCLQKKLINRETNPPVDNQIVRMFHTRKPEAASASVTEDDKSV